MATAANVTYPHIVKEPGYCGGKAAIENTRVRVMNVVYLWKQERTPEQIREEYPDLSFAQIHAALTYYYDHSEEIEASLDAEDGWEERYERRKAEALARRPGR